MSEGMVKAPENKALSDAPTLTAPFFSFDVVVVITVNERLGFLSGDLSKLHTFLSSPLSTSPTFIAEALHTPHKHE